SAVMLDMQRSAESVTMDVRADGEALLVLSELFYPERWRLSVDGRSQPTLKVDALIRGVVVPSGEHVVSFVYDRSRFETGRRVSLAATLLSLALMVSGFVTGRSSSAKSRPSGKP
ncbi:MAG: YfhO family protein, partial [Chlorobiaceae bacterium]|nr:YfhO family protein [Chlorobiaceae bacterium]